jgi:DNA-binding transcriptional LysR family regulator
VDLQQLRCAVAVADEEHFTLGARRLGMAQSAVSARIRKLESELGVVLFERTSRHVKVTSLGQIFLARARAIVDEFDRMVVDVRALSSAVEGRLTIGVITSGDLLGLPAALAELRRRHPGVAVLVKPQLTSTTVSEVLEGTLDVGFVGLTRDTLPKNLVSRRLWSEKLVALVPAGHPWEGRPVVGLGELMTESVIDFPRGTGSRAQSDRAFAEAGFVRSVPTEAAGAELIADLVRGGVGVGILAAGYAARQRDLHAVRIANAPERAVHVITHAENGSTALRVFMSLLHEHLARTEAGRTAPSVDSR